MLKNNYLIYLLNNFNCFQKKIIKRLIFEIFFLSFYVEKSSKKFKEREEKEKKRKINIMKF